MNQLDAHWSSMINDKYVLYGVTLLGKMAIDNLAKVGIVPLAFVDDDPKIQGKIKYGIEVMSLEDSLERYGKHVIYVTTMWRNIKSTLQLLSAMGMQVISFPKLVLKYPDEFLPCFSISPPSQLLDQEEHIKKVESLWSDEESRIEYVSQIKWRYDLDTLVLPPCNPLEELYFPFDLINPIEDEVFVDCGAYDGDTIQEFLKKYRSFDKIYSFEPDPTNYVQLAEYVHNLPDIFFGKVIPYSNAVGLYTGEIDFTMLGTMSSYIGGGDKVKCVALDDMKTIKPSYIKMDIEGSELLALQGAERMIKKNMPVLAICVYHLPNDLWEIPTYLHTMYPEYKLFLRRYLDEWCELICYAVPPNRLIK
jgi:FkbM family methyltransferase